MSKGFIGNLPAAGSVATVVVVDEDGNPGIVEPSEIASAVFFGAAFPENTPAPALLIQCFPGAFSDFIIRIPGAALDGAVSTANPPTLDSTKTLATWDLTSSFQPGAVVSGLPLSTGSYFVAAQITLTGTDSVTALVGFVGSGFDPNSFSSIAGNSDFIGAGTTGSTDLAIAADTLLLDSHTLASGDIVMTAVDLDAGTWAGVVPSGSSYSNLQAQTGAGGHALGMPSGPLSVAVMIIGSSTAGGSIAVQLLTDAALAALGKTGPSGYTNIAG